MELREPKRKRVPPHIKIHQPFPILIESETGIQSHRSLWPVYTGIYNGDCVVVGNPDEMSSLYNMGFFGKGSFSRGYPTFGLTKNGVPPFIHGRQWDRRKKWIEEFEHNLKDNSNHSMEKQINIDKNNEKTNGHNKEETQLISERKDTQDCSTSVTDYSETTIQNSDKSVEFSGTMDVDEESQELNGLNSDQEHDINKTNENNTSLGGDPQNVELRHNSTVVVVNDSDDDEENILNNPKVTIENESIKTVQEVLNLSLEEAFFLSFALGCLQVFDCTGQYFSLNKLWCVFREAQSDFIENYVAYHYFRAKGWIVKPGYKFGGDLMLYKQGPPFYHASYVVVVESVKKENRSSQSLSWNKLHGINRVAETAGKEVLLCQVFWPFLLEDGEIDSPQVLPRFEVNEVLIRRWISSQEREDKE